MSLWDVDDYVRLRTGGDDAGLELFGERLVRPGTRVLDLGCGPGRATAALATRHGAVVTGVDASPEMLAAARRFVPEGVELVEAPAEALRSPAARSTRSSRNSPCTCSTGRGRSPRYAAC